MCQPPLFDEVFAGGATPGLVRPSQPSSLGRVYGRLLVGVLNVVGLGGKTSPAGASVATALFPMPANAKMGSRARATGSPESDDLRSPRGVGRGNAAHGRSATVAEGVMRSPWRPAVLMSLDDLVGRGASSRWSGCPPFRAARGGFAGVRRAGLEHR